MTHFSQRHSRAAVFSAAGSAIRSAAMRDVLWGRPLFRAPQFNPRVPFEPLPFTATRITRRARPTKPSPLVNAPAPAS
jgi:hypothetical protein